MIGLFIQDSDYSTIDFNKLEKVGVTDIFANGLHPPHSPYNDYVKMMEGVYSEIETTNLKLWSDFTPLYLDGWQPPNQEMKEIVSSLIDDIFTEDSFELEGICFDDFAYDPTIWTSSNINLDGTSVEEILLTEFAAHQHDLIHEYGKRLIVNGPIENGRGLYIQNLSEVVDYYAPQLYKNNSYPWCNTDSWLRFKLRQELDYTQKKNIIPILITYNGLDNSLRTVSDVEKQEKSVLRYVDDYILFHEDYFDYDTYLYRPRTEILFPNLLVRTIK